ncbi:hypothetical protein [Streptomyces sp. NPDC012510]|uniref:hypothetical protein n=1 Tax=Streptomyces sp. NPDC012510 TaxID=3364838 RepID=UPI0036F13693
MTAIERLPGIPHATFHRHRADLIDTRFRPCIPDACQFAPRPPRPPLTTRAYVEPPFT